jgi:integrase
MSIYEALKEKRPNLSYLSLTAYTSTLKNLYKKVFNSDKINIKKFDDVEKIMKYLADVPPNKRKSIYAPLVVITGNDKYREAMSEDIEVYNGIISQQKKSKTQEENWIEPEEIKDIFEVLKGQAAILYKKKKPTKSNIQDIQSYIIVALTSGLFIPPRRLLDWTEFKIKNVNEKEDNFYKDGTLYFNRYKGSAKKGEQSVKAPKALQEILDKWIDSNPTDYLLMDISGGKLNNVKLNQRLNKAYGKKISVNSLRHSYLTEKFGDTIKQRKKIEETMEKMGSSSKQLTTYVKEE